MAGPTGTGKTVVVQQQLLKGFDKEFLPQMVQATGLNYRLQGKFALASIARF